MEPQEVSGTLKNLGIKARCDGIRHHRHMVTFDLALDPTTSIAKLENKLREFSLALKLKTVPVMNVVTERGVVELQSAFTEPKTIIHSELFCKTIPTIDKSGFPVLLGEKDDGSPLWMNLIKNPNLLIGGATGSGKSSVIRSIIDSALYLHALNLRNIHLFLVDPKRVELSKYSKYDTIVAGVKTEYSETVSLLQKLYNLMAYRYATMAAKGIDSIEHNIDEFPLVLVVIDEIADLMLQDKDHSFQNALIALAQKGRASGIYLVASTQRPSVDIVTGLIKANFPARIACKVSSRVDSKVILDECGAESLLGRGDAVLKNMEHDRVRFQAAFADGTTEKTYKTLDSLSL